jgi:6-pyruvoyl-tetrahydropterin synthase
VLTQHPAPEKPKPEELEAFKESSDTDMETPLTGDQKLARELVQRLAADLIRELAGEPKTSMTSEENPAAEFVKKLATGLVEKLRAMEAAGTVGQSLADHLKTLSVSEQKLAEDLVQRLAQELKKQSESERKTPGDAEKKAAGDEENPTTELIQQLAKDLVKNLATGPRKPLTCEQKLAKLWEKLRQPQYAIGQNLMQRSDFETLQNSYYS